MRLIFVRHDQTDFNKNKIVQGKEMDPPLNDVGVQQVEEVVKFLPKDIDLIISSPLKRARETAEIINKTLKKDLQLNDKVIEMSYGSLAGKSWSEIETITNDINVHQKERDSLFDYRQYGGDSAEDMKQRVTHFIDELKEKHSNKVILVTTHGGVIDVMHVLFPHKERPARHNATIHEFLFNIGSNAVQPLVC